MPYYKQGARLMKTQATLITQAQTETNDGIIKGVANSLTRTRSGITVTQEAGKKLSVKKCHYFYLMTGLACQLGKLQ